MRKTSFTEALHSDIGAPMLRSPVEQGFTARMYEIGMTSAWNAARHRHLDKDGNGALC